MVKLMGNRQVLKVGGSLLFNDRHELDINRVDEFVAFIKARSDDIDCVVVGGGRMARAYIRGLDVLGVSRGMQDLFGIKVSRMNALLVAAAVGGEAAYQGVPGSIEELVRVKSLQPGKVVFLGGLEVGQSTTSVACEAAESLGSSGLVIGTDVDGIYTADPGKDPKAKKLDTVSIGELAGILGTFASGNQLPGEYRILDAVSMSIIARSGLRVRVVKGDVPVLGKALDGAAVGTSIVP